MQPIWKISGKFAGWIGSSGRLYNAYGDNVGYLREDIVYSLEGTYLREIYQRDRIGKRIDQLHQSKSGLTSLERIYSTPLQDRNSHPIPFGWDDPVF